MGDPPLYRDLTFPSLICTLEGIHMTSLSTSELPIPATWVPPLLSLAVLVEGPQRSRPLLSAKTWGPHSPPALAVTEEQQKTGLHGETRKQTKKQ